LGLFRYKQTGNAMRPLPKVFRTLSISSPHARMALQGPNTRIRLKPSEVGREERRASCAWASFWLAEMANFHVSSRSIFVLFGSGNRATVQAL